MLIDRDQDVGYFLGSGIECKLSGSFYFICLFVSEQERWGGAEGEGVKEF